MAGAAVDDRSVRSTGVEGQLLLVAGDWLQARAYAVGGVVREIGKALETAAAGLGQRRLRMGEEEPVALAAKLGARLRPAAGQTVEIADAAAIVNQVEVFQEISSRTASTPR
jgi:hypothetical protein